MNLHFRDGKIARGKKAAVVRGHRGLPRRDGSESASNTLDTSGRVHGPEGTSCAPRGLPFDLSSCAPYAGTLALGAACRRSSRPAVRFRPDAMPHESQAEHGRSYRSAHAELHQEPWCTPHCKSDISKPFSKQLKSFRRTGHEPVRVDVAFGKRPHARTDVDAHHPTPVSRDQLLGEPSDPAAVVHDHRIDGELQVLG